MRMLKTFLIETRKRGPPLSHDETPDSPTSEVEKHTSLVSDDPNAADIDEIFGRVPPGGEFVSPPDNPIDVCNFSAEKARKIGEEVFELCKSGEWHTICSRIEARVASDRGCPPEDEQGSSREERRSDSDEDSSSMPVDDDPDMHC